MFFLKKKERRLKYIIYAPSYDEKSGGCIALHTLCDTLNQIGEAAYIWPMGSDKSKVSAFKTNKGFKTKMRWRYKLDDYIVVYPEVVEGNPLNSKNVVRWLLNKPGCFTGVVDYGKDDYFFFYEKIFNDEKYNTDMTNKLKIFHINNVYKNKNYKNRNGTCYLLKKGKDKKIAHDLTDSILIDDLNHNSISDIFNKCTTFISYDLYTMYSQYAAICGCTSVVIPDKSMTKEEWMESHASNIYGIAYGFEDIEHAKKTKKLVLPALIKRKQDSIHSVMSFVSKTQKKFNIMK